MSTLSRANGSLSRLARQMMEMEWEKTVHGSDRDPLGVRSASDRCPALWVIEDLLAIVAEQRHEPVSGLRSMIRRVLTEQHYVDDNGDTMLDQIVSGGSEKQLDLVIDVLERVKQLALATGEWSDGDAVVPMCG